VDDKTNNRDHGVIVWWGDRGYGFIRPDHGERDIFTHRSACELAESEEVRIGDRVSYEVGADRRPGREAKICAQRVRFDAATKEPGMFAAPTYGDEA
jgi:CspA family cold shock protein